MEPGKRFSVAVYRQDGPAALTAVGALHLVGTSNVTYLGKSTPTGKFIFQSQSVSSPQQFNSDWGWPSVTLSFSSQVAVKKSAAYAAIVFEVDANGNPTDTIGQKVISGSAIFPYPPDSDRWPCSSDALQHRLRVSPTWFQLRPTTPHN